MYILYIYACMYFEILCIDFKHGKIYSATVIKNAYQELLSL